MKKLANLYIQKLFIEAVKTGKLSVTSEGEVFNNITSRTIGYKANNGYKAVGIKNNGKSHIILVHRLVYLVHKGELKADEEVNHIDGNKENNHVSNLEAVSTAQNIRHAYRTGLHDESIASAKKRYQGHKGNASKLSKKEALELRELFTSGKAKATELSEKYNIHRSNVYRIAKAKTYSY